MYFLTGCAITQDHVRLAYVPESGVTNAVGTNVILVQVVMTDSRTVRDKVSSKKNAYGMEMAAIVSDDDVPNVVKAAIETELKDRGFQVKEGGVTVATELSKFYSNFEVHFWSGTAVAEGNMEVQIKGEKGQIIYSRMIAGRGEEPGCQLASGSNAKAALDRALQDMVARLFADPAFMESLLKAAKLD